MESLTAATARGAHVYAEVCGHGETNDTFHVTAPCEDGRHAAQAMTNAMAEAGLAPADVDYINAHGTGTGAVRPGRDRGDQTGVRSGLRGCRGEFDQGDDRPHARRDRCSRGRGVRPVDRQRLSHPRSIVSSPSRLRYRRSAERCPQEHGSGHRVELDRVRRAQRDTGFRRQNKGGSHAVATDWERHGELEATGHGGAGPFGVRVFIEVSDGVLESDANATGLPPIAGKVLPGGGDWALLGADGWCRLECARCSKHPTAQQFMRSSPASSSHRRCPDGPRGRSRNRVHRPVFPRDAEAGDR